MFIDNYKASYTEISSCKMQYEDNGTKWKSFFNNTFHQRVSGLASSGWNEKQNYKL